MERRAHSAILAANPILNEWGCEETKLGLQLLCGDANPGATQIVRHNNGNWLEVVAPYISAQEVLASPSLANVFDEFLRGEHIENFFFSTPLTGIFSDSIAGALEKYLPTLCSLEWSAIARGALSAGRLIERGLPHYFDRLTPISLAVLKGDEPHFEDLVGSSVTLPANREYVSPPYRDLKWGSGKSEIDFYILKGDAEVRHWQAKLDSPPAHDVAVELRLRQTPGQSWAKLSLTSPDWEPLQRNPIFLDWAMLDPVDKTRDEILELLKRRHLQFRHALSRRHIWSSGKEAPATQASLKRLIGPEYLNRTSLRSYSHVQCAYLRI